MGDAFLPVAENGMEALFYNPAALGHLTSIHSDPINITLSPNSNYMTNLGGSSLKFLNLPNYMGTLNTHPEAVIGAGGAVAPSVYGKGFGLGLLFENYRYARVEGDEIQIKNHFQLIPAVGVGVSLAHGIVRMGYSAQLVNKAIADTQVKTDTNPTWDTNMKQGTAISHTVGYAFTLPFRYLPEFDVVARNIGAARFSNISFLKAVAKGGTGAPENEPMTFDAALKMQPKIGGGVYINWVLELRDFSRQSSATLRQRLATGVEFAFRDTFYIRGGFGSGYPSAGLGLKRGHSEFSFAWYSQEVGTGFQNHKDNRWMIQYRVGAF